MNALSVGLPELRRSAVLLLVLGLTGRCEDARMVANCSQWNTKEFFQQASASDVRACLEAGASLEVRNFFGENRIHVAAMHSDVPSVIEVLVEAGANPNALDRKAPRPCTRPWT